MNFQQYIRQQDPRRHPTVYVTKNDCYGYYPGDLPSAKAIICLEINHEYYMYLLPKDSNVLWTMDEDGNPKRMSCFHFKE